MARAKFIMTACAAVLAATLAIGQAWAQAPGPFVNPPPPPPPPTFNPSSPNTVPQAPETPVSPNLSGSTVPAPLDQGPPAAIHPRHPPAVPSVPVKAPVVNARGHHHRYWHHRSIRRHGRARAIVIDPRVPFIYPLYPCVWQREWDGYWVRNCSF
jgi:hypothetical protein